jgi:hypothetical protein
MAGLPGFPEAVAGLDKTVAEPNDAPTIPAADFFKKLRLDSLPLLIFVSSH